MKGSASQLREDQLELNEAALSNIDLKQEAKLSRYVCHGLQSFQSLIALRSNDGLDK